MLEKSDFSDLLFPQACAGCGRWDFDVCPSCEMLLEEEPVLTALEDSLGVAQLPVFSVGKYGGSLRQLIISAKHQPGRNLAPQLYQVGAHLSQVVSDLLGLASAVWVVPAPSSWRRRWDGRQVTIPIAKGVVDGLGHLLPDSDTKFVPAVRLRMWHGSQSAKSGDARRRGRRGAFALTAKPPAGVVVILVDDVMTTGATILEMQRVVGAAVQAAVVLAVS